MLKEAKIKAETSTCRATKKTMKVDEQISLVDILNGFEMQTK